MQKFRTCHGAGAQRADACEARESLFLSRGSRWLKWQQDFSRAANLRVRWRGRSDWRGRTKRRRTYKTRSAARSARFSSARERLLKPDR
ncbi:MAG: hypothetical protein M3209_09365 [Acidobacteriota bacterium]|nr:hypothetical protein [Acidobacteriota bacterium]